MRTKDSPKFDGILFEWEVESDSDFVSLGQQRNIEVIHCAGSYLTEAEVDDLAKKLPQNPLIYFEAASMTGAELSDIDEMKQFAKLLKSKRPDFCLAAGFGVKTPEDVALLAGIEEMDAVIVGTAFLQAIEKGTASAIDYVDSITRSLTRS